MSISLGEKLGNGVFGDVCEGLVEGNPTYAVKIPTKKGLESLLQEDIILRYLHQDKEITNSYIVRRIDLRPFEDGKMGLVLELLGVNFLKFYNSNPTGCSLEQTRRVTAQLAKALFFLSKNEVIHGDIKPENILVSPDAQSVKLADFGSATFSGPAYNPRNLTIQTIWYRCPEVVLGLSATVAVDVWSLAAVIVEMFCKKVLFEVLVDDEAELAAFHRVRLGSPYPADLVEKATDLGRRTFNKSSSKKIDIVQTLSQIIQGEAARKKEDSSQLMNLLNKMFTFDPAKRITPNEILQHPLIRQKEVPVSGKTSVQEQTVSPVLPGKELSPEDRELLDAYCPVEYLLAAEHRNIG